MVSQGSEMTEQLTHTFLKQFHRLAGEEENFVLVIHNILGSVQLLSCV